MYVYTYIYIYLFLFYFTFISFFVYIIFNFNFHFLHFSFILLLPNSLLHSVLTVTRSVFYCPLSFLYPNFFFLITFHLLLFLFLYSPSSPPPPSPTYTLTSSKCTTHWLVYYINFTHCPILPILQHSDNNTLFHNNWTTSEHTLET
jgi:hypothetical protein